MGTLDGRVALVTGAGQGVGQGIALALAAEGADIAVVGRTAATLESTCALVRERGVRAEAFVCDIVETAAIPGTVAAVVDALGGVDILVNNAYTGAFGPLLTLDDDAVAQSFASGPLATLAFMRSCHPHLAARGDGHIVNLVTSAMVRWDPATYGVYAAAKQAVRALTRTAAVEWARDGIRANSIAPHALSPGLRRWTERHPEEAAEFVATIPMGRIGDCELDIGRAVVALVGSDLGYLTGATIPLDGGQAFFG
ncbi:SDR family NAD(P)-dependent oxidoreductase [Nocardioides sp. R1-1]|uniref:SDR family NAD(P)-dependent oxidoreductase n=1 Tax=Nocardioides sp. R1-1 TaxID=3383502 RepID=UPI0038D1B7CF